MAHFIRYLNGFWVLSIWLTALHADTPQVPREASVRFTVFALGGAEGIAYRPNASEAPLALKFFSAYRSQHYAYRGGARLCFFDQVGGSEANPVAIYDIPEGATKLLLLFFPKEVSSAAGLKYEVQGVDDRVERLPAAHFTTINVSGREYVGQYGASRIVIPQGVGAVHPGKGRVALSLAAQVEGRWMSAGRHEFILGAQDRVTLIFYPPASRTGVYPLIRRLTDTAPSTAAEKTGEVAPSS